LAVFPFHSWLDMVSTESHPFLVSYLFFIIPFIDQYFFDPLHPTKSLVQ